ncbi:hypothetical protein FNV62_05865 [Streptomyces sp. RLB3-17]|nr:hypothetical protein FNV62_05865 [Streptomyces sp. RLB3-17]
MNEQLVAFGLDLANGVLGDPLVRPHRYCLLSAGTAPVGVATRDIRDGLRMAVHGGQAALPRRTEKDQGQEELTDDPAALQTPRPGAAGGKRVFAWLVCGLPDCQCRQVGGGSLH